ncbi:CoF synthetase [Tumebacillus sp. ITR2]|uniref:CoF synthetase n=1 Tax=Tumebacillus amylolyticus TaxID=2801339 RepID=A0ABS1J4G6_9BACL|nr:CoF synthetase [Tumebacillus amylolyticus]MBL0385163.1 CoF synthetase [Tumebacillus amylolyticus]
MREASERIVERVLSYIEEFADSSNLESVHNEAFGKLALDLFAYQFQHNPAYKKYCQARRKSPLTVKHWQDIPPIPFQAWKELTMSCEPVEEAQAVFMTSGSTDPTKKGRNYHPTLQVWDASMVPPFRKFVMAGRDKMAILVLSPAADVNENSSLSRYLTKAVENFGTEDSGFYYDRGLGFEMARLAETMKDLVARNVPVMLMGATFAFVHFLDYCKETKLSFELPEGSRIFDTGGLKGQAREVSAEELLASFQAVFHVNRANCVNMYGMTELSSQMYDRNLETQAAGGEILYDKVGPAWVRTVVLDPDTLQPVERGRTGVLAHYDLANWNSSLALLTEDMGYETDHGFVLLGRAKGAEARGCSIAVDQLLQAQRG